jgi:hypothetical protein
LVTGAVVGGAYELGSIAVHVARGGTIAQIFFGAAAAAATTKMLVVAGVTAGTVYVADKLTEGAITNAIGQTTGYCK